MGEGRAFKLTGCGEGWEGENYGLSKRNKGRTEQKTEQ